LAKYAQAEEFSHFGSSLSSEARLDFLLGKQIYEALQQPPEERYSLVAQQLILETVMKGGGKVEIDVKGMKKAALESAKQIKDVNDEAGFDKLEEELFKRFSSPVKGQAATEVKPAPAAPPAGAKPQETANAKS
jgi:F0F1-type ATP synthase alpha subunit